MKPVACRHLSQLPDQPLSWEEEEQRLLQELERTGGRKGWVLRSLVQLYREAGRLDDAMVCVRRLVESASSLEARAGAYLMWGQSYEQERDYEAAVRVYRLGFALEPVDSDVWYFLNNNLGYSLIQLGRHAEAEPYLRAATQINGSRANAFKNLGLALWGLQRLTEAAEQFVRATEINPSDPRAFWHLEQLVGKNPGLLGDQPGLRQQVKDCCRTVRTTFKLNPGLREHWRRIWRSLPARMRKGGLA
jgi:tetratricopeptide (TPR) repeat protein